MKLHYCFLERFNNYFNRKIIMFTSLADYKNASKDFFIPEDANGAMMPFDFNPNDNVMTEIIANEVPFDPDYFLLLDDDSNIVQRWFVLEQKRNRQGQWLYSLRRDVISDHIDTLYDAPIYVQKGMLQENDPFIVNNEGMSLNQIKQEEKLLTDDSKTGWLVGYIARNSGGSDINVQAPSESYNVPSITLEDIATDTGISVSTLKSLINMGEDLTNPAYVTTAVGIQMYLKQFVLEFPWCYGWEFYVYTDGVSPLQAYLNFNNKWENEIRFADYVGYPTTDYLADVIANAIVNYKSSLLNDLNTIFSRELISSVAFEKLKKYIGATIKYNGQYYEFRLDIEGTTNHSMSSISTSLYTSLTNIYNQVVADPAFEAIAGSKVDKFTSYETKFYIKLSQAQIDIPQIQTVLSSGRNITADQEFDIIAMPLSVTVNEEALNKSWLTDEQMVRRIASAIVLEQNANIYDLQLLPYCPLPTELSLSDNEITVPSSMSEHKDFDYITSTESGVYKFYFNDSDQNEAYGDLVLVFSINNPNEYTIVIDSVHIVYQNSVVPENLLNITIGTTSVEVGMPFSPDPDDVDFEQCYIEYHFDGPIYQGIMFYVKKSSFQSIINVNLNYTESKKILSNCYKWRIVSPNYQGAFDFDVAKNGGSVNYFTAFCTYKPYTPFIKIAPNFEWLYGTEFGDNRGLICAGDFSMPRIASAWETYELNNKNYQNIFNRDIQHLDFMQGIEMRNQIVSGAVGIFNDTAKGAVAGGITTGSPYGAVAGGVLGGVASAVGYAIDVDTLARTQRENRQLAIDKFNYQLGNIKALPYTITTVGVFTEISKIFPFLEIYKCSDNELVAFTNKIKYESMTVMRIGTLREFMNFGGEINYFKGELIRNDEIADDPHTLNAIYEELLKGVYI